MADTQTLALPAFLLARIAEDEAEWAVVHSEYGPRSERLLNEIEAKRRIVEQSERARVVLDGQPMSERLRSDVTPPHAYWMATREAVRALASVYADHPDYRDEWKP